MVWLPESYCIDRTEVTRSQYQVWINTNPPTSEQISECTWNDSFAPDSTCMSSSDVCHGSCGNHPQPCVDWCDAYAYCRAVGKRLCGRIGGAATPWDSATDSTQSQWYSACTSHGLTASGYPYGPTYNAEACNGDDNSTTDHATIVVGSLSTCQASGAYAGVFDLSGNLSEWEDSCQGPGDNLGRCRLRGGTFHATATELKCGPFANGYRGYTYSWIGFRCCSQ
jgi:formylglycine-generating enzyme